MDIETLISQGETEKLEFKESLSLRDEIGYTISAFSNTVGGTIIVGISDQGVITGIRIGKKTVEEFANVIKQNTDPHIFPSLNIVETSDSKKILVIQVGESKEKPVFFKGKAFLRIGSSSHKIGAAEIRTFVKESGPKTYWDSQFCEEATFDDIDHKKVRWFLRKAKFERKFDVGLEPSVYDVLQRLNLMKNGKLTNAAILLFGNNPQKYFLSTEVRCARFKGTEPVKPLLDMKVFDGSIVDQTNNALNFVLEHIPMKVSLEGNIQREEKYDFPKDAIREAIINAVCHRDYEIPANIQIRIFDDRLEIWGCGSLPKPLLVEDLSKKHASILRNPLIGKCLFLIKYVEQWGTGTNDIIHLCLDEGLPEPLFEEISGNLVVNFRKYNFSMKEMKTLNERQIKAINYLLENKTITNGEYHKMNSNVTHRTVLKDLTKLVDKNIIVAKGHKKHRFYILK